MTYNGKINFTFYGPNEQQLSSKNVNQTVTELSILKADQSEDSGYYYCLAQIDQLVMRSKKLYARISQETQNTTCPLKPQKPVTGFVVALTVLSVVIAVLVSAVFVYMCIRLRKKKTQMSTRESLLIQGISA